MDVGTTTVVVLLVDLITGDVLSRAGGFNEQIRFGDNVVTRIDAARNPEVLAAMQRAVVMETIQPLLLRACERAGRAVGADRRWRDRRQHHHAAPARRRGSDPAGHRAIHAALHRGQAGHGRAKSC